MSEIVWLHFCFCLERYYTCYCSDVFMHVDSQARFFNRSQFLDEVSEEERPFYDKVSIG